MSSVDKKIEVYNFCRKKIFAHGKKIKNNDERREYYEKVLDAHKKNVLIMDESKYDPEHDLDSELKEEILRLKGDKKNNDTNKNESIKQKMTKENKRIRLLDWEREAVNTLIVSLVKEELENIYNDDKAITEIFEGISKNFITLFSEDLEETTLEKIRKKGGFTPGAIRKRYYDNTQK